MNKLSSKVQDVDRCVDEQNSESGEMQTKASSRSQIVITQDSVLKAADTRKARELLTGWGHEPVSGAIKEVSQALTTARESERGRCALIADLWGAGISCRSHDDDPCCHIRTGREIAARICATTQPEDDRQTTTVERLSPASLPESEFESESVHQPDVQATDWDEESNGIVAAWFLSLPLGDIDATARKNLANSIAALARRAASPVQPEVSNNERQ